MKTNKNRPFLAHHAGLLAAVPAALLLAFAINGRAQSQFYMMTSDGYGFSSLNGATNWNNGLAPSAGNTYYVTNNFTMRTPADNNAHIFAGNALYLELVPKGRNY